MKWIETHFRQQALVDCDGLILARLQESYDQTVTAYIDDEKFEFIDEASAKKAILKKAAATMLRQQQAEIEALKAELKLIDELVTGKVQEK